MQDELQVELGVGIGQERGLCKYMCIIFLMEFCCYFHCFFMLENSRNIITSLFVVVVVETYYLNSEIGLRKDLQEVGT